MSKRVSQQQQQRKREKMDINNQTKKKNTINEIKFIHIYIG